MTLDRWRTALPSLSMLAAEAGGHLVHRKGDRTMDHLHDKLLADIVGHIEIMGGRGAHVEPPMIVIVSGTVITGLAIPGRRYLKELSQHVNRHMLLALPFGGEALQNALRSTLDTVTREMETAQVVNAVVASYLHLREAKIVGQGAAVGLTDGLLRIRLEAVEGFMLGAPDAPPVPPVPPRV
jgi:hypothetical protein